MSARTVVQRGVTWSVTGDLDGLSEWVRVSGSDRGEYRMAGAGSCGVVDRSTSPGRATTRGAKTTRKPKSAAAKSAISRVALTAQARQAIIDELMRWEDGAFEARETG